MSYIMSWLQNNFVDYIREITNNNGKIIENHIFLILWLMILLLKFWDKNKINKNIDKEKILNWKMYLN